MMRTDMKKIVFVTLFTTLAAIVASAQNGYKAFAEAGYGALTGDKAGSVYQASTSHGILRGNVFIGAGISCDYYSVTNPGYDPDYKLPEHSDGFGHFNHIKKFTGVAIPVFLNIKSFFAARKASPCFDLKAGASAGYATGLFGEAGAGCRYSPGGRTALLVSAFIKYTFEPGNMVTDDSDYMEGAFLNIGLKLAIEL